MQAVSSESQESHGQKINTTVPFMPSFLFSEKRGLESFLFFIFFFREGNNVSFATISDKLFDVLSSELPGQGINFMAELFENCTKCNTG